MGFFFDSAQISDILQKFVANKDISQIFVKYLILMKLMMKVF